MNFISSKLAGLEQRVGPCMAYDNTDEFPCLFTQGEALYLALTMDEEFQLNYIWAMHSSGLDCNKIFMSVWQFIGNANGIFIYRCKAE